MHYKHDKTYQQIAGKDGETHHVHENVGDHVHTELVVPVSILEQLQEPLSVCSPLVCLATDLLTRRSKDKRWSDHLHDFTSNILPQQLLFETAHSVIELFTLLLEDKLVGISVEFLER